MNTQMAFKDNCSEDIKECIWLAFIDSHEAVRAAGAGAGVPLGRRLES